MKSFKEYLIEFVRKGVWEHLLSDDAHEYSKDLVDLVGNAYKHTTLGSFVKSIADIKQSEWMVLDYNENPDLDVVIFYRGPRSNEQWKGKKIQGIGHDGAPESKKKMLEQVAKLLNERGWWIEASDAMATALTKINAPILKDGHEKIFKNITKFNPNGSYIRQIEGKLHTETVFGRPII